MKAENGLFVFERYNENDRLIIAVNTGDDGDISDIIDNCKNVLSTGFYLDTKLGKYTAAVFKKD